MNLKLEVHLLILAKRIGFSHKLDSFLKAYKPTDNHPFFMLMEYMLLYDEAVLDDLLSLLKNEQYDLIICDSYFGGVCFLKQLTDIPVISSHSSFAMEAMPVPPNMLMPGFHTQLDYCYMILNRICEAKKIRAPSIEEFFRGKGA